MTFKDLTQLEKEIDNYEIRIGKADVKYFELRATRDKTTAIIEMIEEEKQKEIGCMERDVYDEQITEHQNQIEMCDKIITKLRGKGK